MIGALILALLAGALYSQIAAAQSAEGGEDPPERALKLVRQIREHTWWLVDWSDNQVRCQLAINHEGLPTASEVYKACGEETWQAWRNTPACQLLETEDDSSRCEGLYLHFVGSQSRAQEITLEVPKPIVWLALEGCEESLDGARCQELPRLVLSAKEFMPGEYITAVHAELAQRSITCLSARCVIQLTTEYPEGVRLEFWADSSLGDVSEAFTARLRVVLSEHGANFPSSLWRVDVISAQWQGSPPRACTLDWEAFPPLEGLPTWLKNPGSPAGLASRAPYEILAGRLLSLGIVEAPECPGGGMASDGSANACGADRTRDFVDHWQDRFDRRIFAVATARRMPARLIKNLFGQESQFWPGPFPKLNEYGLGSLHAHGGDALLLWNKSFYHAFCPQVLSQETCQRNYSDLEEGLQALLRGALTIRANASCPYCLEGFDPEQAELSIDFFAQILQANCSQVGQIMRNINQSSGGEVSSYEDLWRFTLVNYNAGPGCLALALEGVWEKDLPLDWDHVKGELEDRQACQGAVGYVEKITKHPDN